MDRLNDLKKDIHDINNKLILKINNDEHIHLFTNTFLNTVDTTIKYFKDNDTYIITGDIDAMWLRDSINQIVQYLPFINESLNIKDLIKSLIFKQMKFIQIDPYANAFIEDGVSKWVNDNTIMKEFVWERKYELDSICYPVYLINEYYKLTNDSSIFNNDVYSSLKLILDTIYIEQHHNKLSKYSFVRIKKNGIIVDTNKTPTIDCGLIWSGFRPSDDLCEFHYLVPSNLFCKEILNYLLYIFKDIYNDSTYYNKTLDILNNLNNAIYKYCVIKDDYLGTMYAYEVDGMGNYNLMDDANTPSLLSLPLYNDSYYSDLVYLNTRKTLLSRFNKYFYKGNILSGVGSPHTKEGYVWPLAISVRGLTTNFKKELDECMNYLLLSCTSTYLMHESVDCNNNLNYSRDWFAWANAMCSLFMIKYYKLI